MCTGNVSFLRNKPTVKPTDAERIILFIDDDPALCIAVLKFFRGQNFTTYVARNGLEGLMKAAENRNSLLAVITDIQMPEMDGMEFIKRLRRFLPRIPVIVISGMPFIDADKMRFNAMGFVTCLNKPFTGEQLLGDLRIAFLQARNV